MMDKTQMPVITQKPEITQMLDKIILNKIQSGIPIVARPFLQIANELNITEELLLQRINFLKNEKLIRQIAPIFDANKLGYTTCLVAAKVQPNLLASAIELINSHPGVSHNYLRTHSYNLWFTLAVPNDNHLGLDGTAQLIKKLAKLDSIILLPRLKQYKLAVKLDVVNRNMQDTNVSNEKTKKELSDQEIVINHNDTNRLNELDRRLIRALQNDLNIISEPFNDIANNLGITIEQLLNLFIKYKSTGIIRRFAAVLHHRKVGYKVNCLNVWNIPIELSDQIGFEFAKVQNVSHCYRRANTDDFPYNLYTMIHAKSSDHLTSIVSDMSKLANTIAKTSVKFISLHTEKELKKKRVKFFTSDIDNWGKDLI